jgi:acid phosphatase type 7
MPYPKKFTSLINAPRPRAWVMLAVAVSSLFAAGLASADAPFNVYLTYRGDTSRAIVVNYHLNVRLRDAPEPMVYWDTTARAGDKAAYANHTAGTKSEMPELPIYRTLNWIEVTGLEPDTVYYFIAGDDQNGYTEERSFRTIPAGDQPLRFATGGDLGVTPLTERLLAQTGQQDPLFCAIGGDIAYVNGRFWQYETWDRWFANYDRYMRTTDGHMIPMLMGIGNHETNRLPTTDPVIKAPFYTAFFGQQQADTKTYFTQQFGKNILFIVLDTGHVAPHAGEQAAWLAETLAASTDFLYKFALYHVPLYPSHRAYEGEGSRLGRVHWEPYFTAFGLTTAFENHDHTLKRSKRISNNQIDDEGVLYLGDGSFGVNPRTVEPELRWYLDLQESAGHIWIVDVSTDDIHYRALGDQGQLLDEYRHATDLPLFDPEAGLTR